MPATREKTHKYLDALKPKDKPYREWIGNGLYLEVRPATAHRPEGSKLWRLKYRFQGKEKLAALGTFPETSLVSAKAEAATKKAELRSGTDPSAAQRAENEARAAETAAKRADAALTRHTAAAARMRLRAEKRAQESTFAKVAEEWHTKHDGDWTRVHSDGVWQSLDDHVIPYIGKLPIGGITPAQVDGVLDRLLTARKIETADRVKQRMGAVFRYAALQGLVTGDPTALLADIYKVRKKQLRKTTPKQHHHALPEEDLGAFVRRMRAVYATPVVNAAFWLMLLTAARTGEIRGARWTEFKGLDGDTPEWNVPPERMKARKPHWVPLSAQAATILRQLKPATWEYGYVFPIVTRKLQEPKPISENAVLYLITKSAGYAGSMTGHGMRSLFSTWANNEHRWPADVIELSLAHGDPDKVRAAYARGQFKEKRRELMQAWADHIERLGQENVIPLRGRA